VLETALAKGIIRVLMELVSLSFPRYLRESWKRSSESMVGNQLFCTDYSKNRHGRWMIAYKKSLKDVAYIVKLMHVVLWSHTNPLGRGRIDEKILLGDYEYWNHQMLIDMLVWIVTRNERLVF
jgi:hypothetical protein